MGIDKYFSMRATILFVLFALTAVSVARKCDGKYWTFHSNTRIPEMNTYNCMNAAVPCKSAKYSFQAEKLLKEDYPKAATMNWSYGYCKNSSKDSAPWVYGKNKTTWRYSTTKKVVRERRLRECEGGMWTFHSMTYIPAMTTYNCMNAAVPCGAAQYSFQAENKLKEDYPTARSMTWRWGYCENTTANSAPWQYGANGTTWRYSTSPARRELRGRGRRDRRPRRNRRGRRPRRLAETERELRGRGRRDRRPRRNRRGRRPRMLI